MGGFDILYPHRAYVLVIYGGVILKYLIECPLSDGVLVQYFTTRVLEHCPYVLCDLLHVYHQRHTVTYYVRWALAARNGY